ncbi:hypothetical protein KORDIASMS9_03504 [Kordia sp. SMS9]|nr:hypothetical protein KORDIASMS9_03504 [Kordia sp. SMS9]
MKKKELKSLVLQRKQYLIELHMDYQEEAATAT